jgi:hypothetical protein
MRFEDDLRTALQRIEAPGGFAMRVVARARLRQVSLDDRPGHALEPPTARSWVVVLATAASLILATSSGLVFLDHQKRADAERARGLALQALRVASVELQQIQSRLVNRYVASASDEQSSQTPSEQRP